MNAFFGLKTDVNRGNLGMISAWHTNKRQGLKKVTCPFKWIGLLNNKVIVEEELYFFITHVYRTNLRGKYN